MTLRPRWEGPGPLEMRVFAFDGRFEGFEFYADFSPFGRAHMGMGDVEEYG